MANADAAYGALLIDSEGKQYKVRRFVKKTGSAIYPGDFVKRASTGNVEVADAGAVLLGVAMEYKAATSTDEIAICDDPDAVFEIQASADAQAADVFTNANIVATAGDTGKLQSKHTLDSSTIATTNTLQLRILGLHSIGSNAYGSYARLKVKINQHAYSSGVLGV
jgi:hypothetical protein